MPQRVVSDDLKCHIPILRHEGYSVKNICHVLSIRKSMVYSVLKQYQQFGSIGNPHKYSCVVGHPRSLNQDDYAFLSAIVDHRRSIYLDELQSELQLKRNIQVTLSTLSRTLQRLGVTRKIISACAYERNELLRAMYMNQIGKEVPDANMLMFVDEAAKDERTVFRKYGRSLRGVRCVSRRQFVHGTRYSIIPVLTLDGIIAYDIVEGPVNTERFLKFLKDQVMPFTNPYPGPRSVLVMDNCRIHHGDEVRHLVEEENFCRLIYLPAYSPDYNPIEQAFSAIKSYLRRHSHDLPLMSIVRACQSITPDKAEGYFRASGYIT